MLRSLGRVFTQAPCIADKRDIFLVADLGSLQSDNLTPASLAT